MRRTLLEFPLCALIMQCGIAAEKLAELRPLGLIRGTPPHAPRASAVLKEIREKRQRQKFVPLALPSSADNSDGLPPVGDHGDQGSCTPWAVAYYYKSYQEAREHGWNLSDPAHRFSPAFLYNQLQYYDEGSTFEDNFRLLMDQGCAAMAQMPYDEADHLSWPDARTYRAAIPYRAASYDYLGTGETPDILDVVKAVISDGDLCVVGIEVFDQSPSLPGRFRRLSASDFHYLMPDAEDRFHAGDHAVTIVGYDESKFDGKGGYKIVNSWGTNWGESGFAWLSEPFLATHAFGFYRMTDRAGYAPTAFAHFKVEHAYWHYDKVTVTIGVGPIGAPLWSKVMQKNVPRGYEDPGFRLTIDRWADISEAAAYLPPDWTNRWWLKVEDPTLMDPGTIYSFEIEALSATYDAKGVLPFGCGYHPNTVYIYIPAGESSSRNYYVNDEGDDANDGLSPATPKRTVQAVIHQYTLKGGDTVWIDAGEYNLASNITLNHLDRGESGRPIRFVGVEAENGELATIINRDGQSGASFELSSGNRFVQLENLWLKGGGNGVHCDGSWAFGQGDLTLQNVRISNTSAYACYLFEAQGVVLRRCLFHDFGAYSGLYVDRSTAVLEHSVIAGQPSQTCAALDSGESTHASNAYLTLTNSILTGGQCVYIEPSYCQVSSAKYNDLFADTIGFTPDETNISLDPLFADEEIGDFHLKSSAGRWSPAANGGRGGWILDAEDSPCIDAGDPEKHYSQEPLRNGGRINMGVYGGTPWASKSGLARHLTVLAPNGGETWRGVHEIVWKYWGAGWLPADTITLEYWDGATWVLLDGESTGVPFNAGAYSWDISSSGIATGDQFKVRVGLDADRTVFDESDSTFTLQEGGSAYYVNDGSTIGDEWCTAPGDDANDGLSPATPKASPQAILDSYDLEPGDTVYVDTGTYELSTGVTMAAEDGGSAIGQVRILGSPNGSTLHCLTAGTTAVTVVASYVTVEGLRCTGGSGIAASGEHCVVKRNVCIGPGSAGTGIAVGELGEVENNICTGHALGLLLSPRTMAKNNTIYSGGDGIRPTSSVWHSGITIRNNIVWAAGSGKWCLSQNAGIVSCDHNDFIGGLTKGCATLLDWQNRTGFDVHSLSIDPLFADVENGDFHLRSTGGRHDPSLGLPPQDPAAWVLDEVNSPLIDTGDPADPVGYERPPNGGRINMGAYGGTNQASKSPTGRILVLLSPNGREVWSGVETIRWEATGQSWTTGNTVRIEYSSDGGIAWSAIADEIPRNVRQLPWDTRSLPDDVDYRVRVTCNQDESACDSSDENFTIHNVGITYYVNDGSTENDEWCTARGDDANDGLSPATPKASIQAILDSYDLEPGDTVRVDTGNYALAGDVMITAGDGGSSEGYVEIIGSPRGATLNRGSVANRAACIYVTSGAYVRIENMICTGGYYGVRIFLADHCVIEHNVLRDNTTGIWRESAYGDTSTALVKNNTIIGGSKGLEDSGGGLLTLRNNIFSSTGADSCAIVCRGAPASDHNLFHVPWGKIGKVRDTEYPALLLWTQATGQDKHSLIGDPLFADLEGGDFHLKSTGGRYDPSLGLPPEDAAAWVDDGADSPCIDAGDPLDPIDLELEENGHRINMGAYGGTNQASKSPTGRILILLSPNGTEMWQGRMTILWTAAGAGWDEGDTVRIQYSHDGGAVWETIADEILYATGQVPWDTRSVSDDVDYRVRLTCNQDPSVGDSSSENFTIHNVGIAYYVNDGSTENDEWCTARGNDANDGLSPATPKASIQAILDSYDLEPGDTVRVDTGNYALAGDVMITAGDGGSSEGYVQIIGSPGGATLNRGSVANKAACIYVTSGAYVRIENMICTGGYYGIRICARGSPTTQFMVEGNTLRDNRIGLGLEWYYSDFGLMVLVKNNTIIGGSQGLVSSRGSGPTLRNNIFSLGGTDSWGIVCHAPPVSEYNHFDLPEGKIGKVRDTGYPALLLWTQATGQDRHSLVGDPLFADPEGGDFHLKSTGGRYDPSLGLPPEDAAAWVDDGADSPCIDAGDPVDPVGYERPPNGGRINMGAYGGTNQASKSPTGRILILLSPNGGELWRGTGTIRWTHVGQAWQEADTVSLYYSADSGVNWTLISGSNGLPSQRGEFEWSLYGLPQGSQYRVKVESDQDVSVWDTSNQELSLEPGQAYFVNDGETNNDEWCKTPGDDTNDGLTPATPKASIQAILDAYNLEPGDTIFVDAGIYDLTDDIVVGSEDGGSASGQIRILGVRGKSILDRGDPATSGSTCIDLSGGYVTLESLDCRNAYYGILVNKGSDYCKISCNSVFGCGYHGIYVHEALDAAIEHNVVSHSGSGAGICLRAYSYAGDYRGLPCTVRNNTVQAVGTIGVEVYTAGGPSLRNNVICATGAGHFCIYARDIRAIEASDYNNLYAVSGAKVGKVLNSESTTLGEWRELTWWDVNSISFDPLFADPENDDYHLKSGEGRRDPRANDGEGGWVEDSVTSPCIDAGDPASDYSQEPLPNGGRINMGAYGGTAEASKSPAKWLIFEGVGRGEALHAWQAIRWEARGTRWEPTETVRLEYSDDSGATWYYIPGATDLPYNSSPFWWDTRTVPNGNQYHFRLICDSAPVVVPYEERRYRIENNMYAPTLSWTGETGYESDGVYPDAGVSATKFTFRVSYADGDNHPPEAEYPRLHVFKGGAEISGSPFVLSEADSGDIGYTDGKVYLFTLSDFTLCLGEDYAYYFEAQDTHAAPASGEPTSLHRGPVVLGLTSADLVLTKTASPSLIVVGQSLTYKIEVRNNGPDAATGVVVTDVLPEGLEFISASASQGTCEGTSTVTCELGRINSGGSATVTVVVRPVKTGAITNSANVEASEWDPTPPLAGVTTEVPFDSDGDEMDDGWEWKYFQTLQHAATDDPDDDRADNYSELVAGTDPTDKTSLFRVEDIVAGPGGAGHLIRVATQPGKKYTIYYADSLLPDEEGRVWYAFANTTNGVGTWEETSSKSRAYTFWDDEGRDTTGGPPPSGCRFYRVQVENP